MIHESLAALMASSVSQGASGLADGVGGAISTAAETASKGDPGAAALVLGVIMICVSLIIVCLCGWVVFKAYRDALGGYQEALTSKDKDQKILIDAIKEMQQSQTALTANLNAFNEPVIKALTKEIEVHDDRIISLLNQVIRNQQP